MLLPAIPRQVAESLRRRFDDQEQAIFGMSLAGIARDEISRILGLSEAGLESRLWEMLRKLESMDVDPMIRLKARQPSTVGA
jgi:DNA-directed RNA polymerase specialized sigma24 family protein